jgi:hypothetical protein
MKKLMLAAMLISTALGTASGFAQVKMTRDQMMFYTSVW